MRAGRPVTGLRALAGLTALVLVIVGLVTVLRWMLPPQDPAAMRLARDLASPANALGQEQPGVPVCPAPGLVPRDASSTLLYECPDRYDGLVVTYTGEVVGEILRRDDRAWVRLNDDPYGLSLGPLTSHGVAVGGNSGVTVSLPAAAADRITSVGERERAGDVVTVQGVYRPADPDAGGAATIRAIRVLEIRTGGPRERAEYPGRRLAAVILLPVTLAVAVAAYRERLARVVPGLRRRRLREREAADGG